ncbi:hypothetical protein GJAV_G00188320 [Gymnothorax javanicus]|nr:hypothetical protein GJAV_G00188320 [Gymnothorax javanicus]
MPTDPSVHQRQKPVTDICYKSDIRSLMDFSTPDSSLDKEMERMRERKRERVTDEATPDRRSSASEGDITGRHRLSFPRRRSFPTAEVDAKAPAERTRSSLIWPFE